MSDRTPPQKWHLWLEIVRMVIALTGLAALILVVVLVVSGNIEVIFDVRFVDGRR